jgi:hypothetical protein
MLLRVPDGMEFDPDSLMPADPAHEGKERRRGSRPGQVRREPEPVQIYTQPPSRLTRRLRCE